MLSFFVMGYIFSRMAINAHGRKKFHPVYPKNLFTFSEFSEVLTLKIWGEKRL